MPSMKIADVTAFWSERGGGVRSYLTAKARAMAGFGVEHRVLATGLRTEQSILSHTPTGCSKLLRLGGPALPYDPSYQLFVKPRTVRRYLRNLEPDVLEIHSPEMLALTALSTERSRRSVRTLVWHSDFIDTHLTWRISRRSSERIATVATSPLWGWVRALAHRCDATIVASRSQATKLRTHGIRGVTELPFGVDTRVFRPEVRDPDLRRRLLGDRPGRLVVGVGRFAVEKQWHLLIEAVQRTGAGRPHVLLLVGDGPERADLERRAGAGADVRFMGFERDREALARLVASADALVHCGPFETFGLVVAEAVACGTPVVVPDAGAAKEQAAPGCSECFRSGDAESLAAALDRLFARDASDLARAARAAARTALTVDDHFRALMALYAELLDRARGSALPSATH